MFQARASGLGSMLRRCGVVIFMVAGLGACAAVYRNHGYVPSEAELALIEVGRDTRETVGAAIGRPGAAGVLKDAGWFYVQSRWRELGYRAPEVIDRQVVAISFTDAGVVSNIERFTLADGRVVPLSRRVTETDVKGATFIGQLLSGIGRLSAEQLVD